MRITVNDNIKTVSFWICNGENRDDAMIDHTFKELKKDGKYRKIIFASGTGDLLYNTRELIKTNQQ